MAFSGVEYLQPSIGGVPSLAASPTDIVCLNGNVFDVFDLSSSTASEYGTSGGDWANGADGLVYAAGKFWFNNVWSGYLYVGISPIDTSTWAATPGVGYNRRGALVVCGDWVYGTDARYDTSTNTQSSYTTAGYVLGSMSGRMFAGVGTTLSEINPSTASVITSWTLPIAVKPYSHRGAAVGSRLFFGTDNQSIPVVFFDTDTDTVGAIAATPPLAYDPTSTWVGHSDGYLYATGLESKLMVLDPATGRNDVDDLVTPRTGRRAVLSVGSDLWIPTTEPSPWP